MGKYMNPLLDFSFKRLFGQDANKELLIDFLNILFEGERKVEDITFMDKEIPSEFLEGRMVIFDILCREKDGTFFIVEMQNSNQFYFFDRALFYLCRMISSQGQKGSGWNFKICPVYGIYFLNFRLPGLEKLRTDVILADRDTGIQTDKRLRQIFISLPHFNLEADECKTDFERWIYLFKNMDTLERIPFETKKATFKKLLKAAEVESLNSGDRWLYDKILKNYRDYVNTVEYAKVEGERRGIKIGREKGIAEGKMKGIEIGREKGIAEGKMKGIEIGREKGRKEEKRLLAIQLKKEGLPFDFISRLTGLPPEEIKLL
ncbi:Rpn family recombination-promoting nuclease/putative transposase [Parabacteroides sp. PF5-6]|uniref:Rpn family recombination-promoting nuclease/putative transposase n=1 Tax=Parabacteroides sp. PF5-6 TaxID=1742403 RepID=UPI00240710B4|nr:Rpn family recombination-promoting nuclease/putative transposase [Parabacteroides sp. PF5-6]MDF9828757.1 putative transposase/invertase (TIGR01784 family) [Parabacteroides sp. PF5-6]